MTINRQEVKSVKSVTWHGKKCLSKSNVPLHFACCLRKIQFSPEYSTRDRSLFHPGILYPNKWKWCLNQLGTDCCFYTWIQNVFQIRPEWLLGIGTPHSHWEKRLGRKKMHICGRGSTDFKTLNKVMAEADRLYVGCLAFTLHYTIERPKWSIFINLLCVLAAFTPVVFIIDSIKHFQIN